MLRVGVTGAPAGVGAADAVGLLPAPGAAADVLPGAGWVDAWPPPLVPAASCPLAPPPPQAARPRVSATAEVQAAARRRGANITTNLGNGRAVAQVGTVPTGDGRWPSTAVRRCLNTAIAGVVRSADGIRPRLLPCRAPGRWTSALARRRPTGHVGGYAEPGPHQVRDRAVGARPERSSTPASAHSVGSRRGSAGLPTGRLAGVHLQPLGPGGEEG